MKRFFALGLIMCFAASFAAAQSQQDDDEEFMREFTYGFNFNTNGGLLGGGMLKWTRTHSPNYYRFFEVEVVEVKHPKEVRYANERTNNVFVLGKSNYLFVIRPQYGMERVIFRKAPEQGVQVNVLAAAGLSLGLLKPYLIQYDYTQYGGNGYPIGEPDIRIEQYDPKIHTNPESRILGNAGFANGITDAKVKPGLHTKVGLSFEHGQFRESVAGIEVGVMVEAYPQKMIIIPQARNNAVFTSAYLVLYYGHRR